MTTVDWGAVLCRASCSGKVLTNGRGTVLTEKQAEYMKTLEGKLSLTAKQELDLAELIRKRDTPPPLSDTCTTYLKEVYIKAKYGKESMGGASRSRYTIKGKSVEDESIMILSRIDDKQYEKNEERLEDDYFTGECDILSPYEDMIKDIKSSWDFATFLAVIGKPLNEDYYFQGQVYLHLWKRKKYEVCYVLVSMPQELIESEKKKIFYTMNPATEESPEYKREIEKLENSWTFDDVPVRERIIKFPFEYDPSVIERLHRKWDQCRIWLEEFEKIHLSIAA